MTGFREWINGDETNQMAGFAHVRRMMLGDIQNIDKLGILTAANPNAKKISNKKNDARMQNMATVLRNNNFGPILVDGQYGHSEPSFIVPHLSRQAAIDLGKDFDQESVIYGEKFVKPDGKSSMKFELISCSDQKVISTRCLSLSNDVQGQTDNFSQVKGRKFVIPFFDNEYATDSSCM